MFIMKKFRGTVIFWKKEKKTWKNQFLAGKFSKNQKSSFLSPYSNKLIRPRQSFFVIIKNVEKLPQHWLFWNLTKNFKKTAKKHQKSRKNCRKNFAKKYTIRLPQLCLCPKKTSLFRIFPTKIDLLGHFWKKSWFWPKKTPLFPQKVQLITLFRKNAFPSYILEFCPLPTCKVWRNSILPFSRTWIIFLFS